MLDETRVREIVKEDFPIFRHAICTAIGAALGAAIGGVIVQAVLKFCFH